jgi:hypothetical protein
VSVEGSGSAGPAGTAQVGEGAGTAGGGGGPGTTHRGGEAGSREGRNRRRALLIALAAVFVGLCTLVGEALIPSSLPPRDGLSWAAFLLALLLFAITFGVSVAISAWLDEIAESIAGPPGKLRRRQPGQRKRWVYRTLTVVLIFVLVVVGVWRLADPAKLIKEDPVGGLDLARYCRSYGYSTNSDELCSWNIRLNEACDWQYRRPDHKFRAESGPYSGVCYNSGDVAVGGINDMQGFCRFRFRTSLNVRPVVVNGETWACQVPIDKDVACTWQWLKADLEARNVDGLWTCYQ